MAVNVLLPLDGSQFSEHALPAALDLAVRLNARLHLVRVHEPPVLLPGDAVVVVEAGVGGVMRQHEGEYLARIAERCGAVTTRVELLEGSVATALATYVQDARIDLVVMSTHGRSGISRAWVGSVSDALVRRAAVPVLLLRPVEGEREPAPIGCRHVLVPLDGSPLAEGILPPLTAFARLFRPRITLVRVLPPVHVTAESQGAAWVAHDPQTLQQAGDAARISLERVADRLRAHQLTVETAVSVHSVPAVAILDEAARSGVDMIAMATHGRGGWSRVAIGSVADKVMRGSLLPILLYRPPADLGADVEHSRTATAQS